MEAGLLDKAPIWSDLKTFPAQEFRDRVDLLVAGYPCQPFSAAGKRLGTEDPRHLWPHIAGSIRVIRPRFCFFENVEGHISLGLREVIGELEEIGYQTAWGIFSAREVGAPHQRKRVFILAYLKCAGLEGLYKWYTPSEQTQLVGADSGASCQRSAWEGCLANSNDQHGHGEERGGSPEEDRISSEHREEEHSRRELGRADAAGGEGCGELADASCHGHNGRQLQDGMDRWKGGQLSQPQRGESGSLRSKTFGCRQAWPSRPGEPQHGWEPPRVVLANAANHGHAASASGGGICGDEQDARRQEESQGVEQLAGGGSFAGLSSELGNASGSGHSRQAWSGGECTQGQPIGYVAESDGAMGYTNSTRPQERQGQRGAGIQRINSHGGEDAERQTQPPLGGNSDGPADWLDYAELYTTCDNRTDELRLLGNGVVPATAERAFRTLLTELLTPPNI